MKTTTATNTDPIHVVIDWNIRDIVFGPEKLQEISGLMQNYYVITRYEDDKYGNVRITFRRAIPECMEHKGDEAPDFDSIPYQQITWTKRFNNEDQCHRVVLDAAQKGWACDYFFDRILSTCAFRFNLSKVRTNKFGLKSNFRETDPLFRVAVTDDDKERQIAMLHYLTKNGYSITDAQTTIGEEDDAKTIYTVEINPNASSPAGAHVAAGNYSPTLE